MSFSFKRHGNGRSCGSLFQSDEGAKAAGDKQAKKNVRKEKSVI
jgi:hypothetical protein